MLLLGLRQLTYSSNVRISSCGHCERSSSSGVSDLPRSRAPRTERRLQGSPTLQRRLRSPAGSCPRVWRQSPSRRRGVSLTGGHERANGGGGPDKLAVGESERQQGAPHDRSCRQKKSKDARSTNTRLLTVGVPRHNDQSRHVVLVRRRQRGRRELDGGKKHFFYFCGNGTVSSGPIARSLSISSFLSSLPCNPALHHSITAKHP